MQAFEITSAGINQILTELISCFCFGKFSTEIFYQRAVIDSVSSSAAVISETDKGIKLVLCQVKSLCLVADFDNIIRWQASL
jgi:hypothetical protein